MRWVVLLALLLALAGCGAKQEIVYRNIYIESECPRLETFERPQLYRLQIDFPADRDTAEIHIDDVRGLWRNESALLAVILAYEEMVRVYQR
jgi:hypothetical protein